MKKISILLCSILVIGLFGTIASADSISDPLGDVAHWNYTGTLWGWNYNVGNKPDVDIVELKHSINENKLILELVVDGIIQTSDLYAYSAWFNTSDSFYWFYWSNGQGGGMAMNTNGGFNMSQAVATANGNTLSATFDLIGGSIVPEKYWGYAWHYTELGNAVSAEWWGDWIPNEESPFFGDETENSNDDNDDGGESNGNSNESGTTDDNSSGMPGFEIITFFIAILGLIFIFKKRK